VTRRTGRWLLLGAAALAVAAGLPPPASAQGTGGGAAPTIRVTGFSVAEGNSGTTTASFVVGLSAASRGPVTVQAATRDGTALAADGDYQPVATTLTLDPGATSAVVDVTIRGDLVEEADEILFLELARPSGATLEAARAEGEIVDDDGVAGPGEGTTVAIEDAQVTEGGGGRTRLRFTVTLSSPAPVPVTVDFATADGSAVAEEDYEEATGQVRFPRGAISRQVQVTVLGDALEEGDEEVVVALANPVGAVLARDSAVGLILDDDEPGALSMEPVGALERRGRPGRTVVLQVRLRNSAGEPVAGAPVHWEVDGDATLVDGPATLTARSGRATQRVLLGSGSGRLAIRAHDASRSEVVLYQIAVSVPVGS
jgi:hypothetical protein